jgi:Protein involved in biosynthesis of mitomycin antibiotics/polyketide fumonisin
LSSVSVSSGPVRFIPGSNHWEDINGLDFFDKDLISQEKILEEKHGDLKVVSALLSAGQVSIHSSQTYHSSGANLDEVPRVGMVVHFCTDRATRKPVTGLDAAYLDQLNDASISPVIYGGSP